MTVFKCQHGVEFAKQMYDEVELNHYRDQFHFPIQKSGDPFIYLCGNSLGLQPKQTEEVIQQELINWKNLAVKGHFNGENPWTEYDDVLTQPMANVVGAKPEEVIVMNTLTVNLHLMLISFYRPKGLRNKILIEADAFPSDKFAIESQIRLHGLDPKECLIELKARPDELCLRVEDIQEAIHSQGHEIALILFGNTNYYTGQYFDMKQIANWGHDHGCFVGFDCAHGAGNLPLKLHDSGCDFAVWCNYKYLNAGPGGMAGAFVHERHHHDQSMPRLEGWWGHNKATRFNMRGAFDPIPTTEAWQLSNPPILAMAAVRASLNLFDEIGMDTLRKKSKALTSYAEFLVKSLGEDVIKIITPSDPEKRGCQLSIQVKNATTDLFDAITARGVILDWREPDVIRMAAAPMYNSFTDVYQFYSILKSVLAR